VGVIRVRFAYYRGGGMGMGRFRLQSENGKFFTKSDFGSTIRRHLYISLNILCHQILISYLVGILCMFCIVIGTFDIYKFMIIY